MFASLAVLSALTLSTACVEEPVSDIPDHLTLLSPREQLIRVSVDLRGVHPSEADLDRIDQNPNLYSDFVDRYIDDERFLNRASVILNTRMLVRTGDIELDPMALGIAMSPEEAARHTNEEPLALARHIIAEDLPWSDIVMADYTMADPVTAAMWDIEIPEDAQGWVPGTYRDERPHAGILSMTTLWTRYPSAGVNQNRHRANAISMMLLCDDYLARPVSFSRTQIDALTSGDPEDVIAQTPACQSCHSSLDPLAAHFYGFWWDQDDMAPAELHILYRPEDEPLWEYGAGLEPAWQGMPTTDLVELAEGLAEERRFSQCAVQTFWEGLTQRTVVDADWDELARHEQAFLDSEMSIKTLVRSVVLSPEYLADSSSDPEVAARLVNVKTVQPDQLESVMRDITGYEWMFDGIRGLERSDLMVLGGGIDSRDVAAPSHDPSVAKVFIQERLAQSSAFDVATHDLDPEREAPARMLTHVDSSSRPDKDPELFKAQICDLYLQATGLPLRDDAPEVELLTTLWRELWSVQEDPVDAWAGVIAVVLRDPRILLY